MMAPIPSVVDLVRENCRPGMVVVEVGIWQGDTALAWLPIVKEVGSRGILIDHFKGNIAQGEGAFTCPWEPTAVLARCERLAEKLQKEGYEGVVEIWWMSSRWGAAELADGSCDIVFIDADHRRSAVGRDISLYLPKVKAGGVLCGHDCHCLSDAGELPAELLEMDIAIEGPHRGRHCGVDRAVWEAFGADEVEIRTHNLWVWRKPHGEGE